MSAEILTKYAARWRTERHRQAIRHAARMGTLVRYMETRKRDAGDNHYLAQPVNLAFNSYCEQWEMLDSEFTTILWRVYFRRQFAFSSRW